MSETKLTVAEVMVDNFLILWGLVTALWDSQFTSNWLSKFINYFEATWSNQLYSNTFCKIHTISSWITYQEVTIKLLNLNFNIYAIIKNLFKIHCYVIGRNLKTMDNRFSQEINILKSFHFSFSKSIDASLLLIGRGRFKKGKGWDQTYPPSQP